ncbi:hypothetical protein [Lentzea jiangxiensis]|uniref:Uncharacterized protein n=1 Tax=Lentzea jiangxiensis TaxID=641025 RepID=A0A1H0JWR8_9PSEU|nr:hypothetical protein [Lentzea jiangxiensis]SDO48060.1 hypothetical protein SAMN05421507_102668 [Lentzea jiangxiensis]
MSANAAKSSFTYQHGTAAHDTWSDGACTDGMCSVQHLNWRWSVAAGGRVETTFTLSGTPRPGRVIGERIKRGTCNEAILDWTITTGQKHLDNGTLQGDRSSQPLALPLPADATTVTVTATRRDNHSCETTLDWVDSLRP